MAVTLEAAMDSGEQVVRCLVSWGLWMFTVGCWVLHGILLWLPTSPWYPWPGRVKYPREKCLVVRSL